MAKGPSLVLIALVAGGLSTFAPGHGSARAKRPDPCDAIVGTWVWFTGGTVTIQADHTMVYQRDRYVAPLDLWNGGDSTPTVVDDQKRMGSRH